MLADHRAFRALLPVLALLAGTMSWDTPGFGCSARNPLIDLVEEVSGSWQSRPENTSLPAPKQHALMGKVFKPDAGLIADDAYSQVCGPHSPMTGLAADLQKQSSDGGILVFGEVHDNSEHHRLRAAMSRLIASGHPTAIAFEQIRADQQAGLDKFADFNAHAARLGNAGDLKRFLDWDKSPWSKMADYTPLFDAAVSARLPVYAADPPRDVIRKAAKEGLAAALPAEERTGLISFPMPWGSRSEVLADFDAGVASPASLLFNAGDFLTALPLLLPNSTPSTLRAE